MSEVLVVEDRPSDRDLLVTLLGYAGYGVREATTGTEALEKAIAEPPDLIITDIMMPSMNGLELVRELRSRPETGTIPVVFYTAGYTESEVRRLTDAGGVARFIPKPSDPDTIIAAVGEALGSPATLMAPVAARDFDREQLRVVNDKLVQKVSELEAVSVERQRLVVQLLQAHEVERHWLAGALHDDPIQALAALTMQLGIRVGETQDPALARALEQMKQDAAETVERLRKLMFELQPAELDRQGLRVALKVYLERIRDDDGLAFELDDRTTRQPGSATRSLLYRMAQEALVNVRKHANASKVEVTIDEFDQGFLVRVRDDGDGFSPEEAMRVRPGHLGLPSMRERVGIAGGTLRVRSRPSAGATVEVVVPDIDGAVDDGSEGAVP